MSEQIYSLAFVFPGQGSQSIGMLSSLAAAYPEIKDTFDQASDILETNLWSLVENGPIEDLNQTQNTQPVMLAAGYAVWRLWCKLSDVRPGWVAGHSLGEYTALVCSESLSFADAIRVVAERGRLMQVAVPAGEGAMAAIIGLEDHQVGKVCLDAAQGEVVSAVNFNAPGQVVIAGNAAAVERALVLAKESGAKRALPLPVSVPSHCALMEGAAEKLAAYLEGINLETPRMTLIHNVDISTHSAPEVIRNVLKEQLYKPVRWVDSIKFMSEQGVSRFVECGPGKVLIGLNKRIVKEADHLSIFDPESLDQALEKLNG
ncbi:ACP S-malonyltransferase [Methylicorpusculum oleiharenae]|uniref:ACP S-malonyltransferase n=1 Tax=Methylicorpusculum oleiharenae TaxID=1338687 RepID=UPI00135A99A3|nr:ACP S-malonyltransferase [Methylicorpusculum oleiharenae]MCD2453132.1 ACP S-malonyltransferase [Methylicorpusculum oleiharenae]